MEKGYTKMKNKLESVVIVTSKKGAVATIRFNNSVGDKIISSAKKNILYSLVEKHIKKVLENAR